MAVAPPDCPPNEAIFGNYSESLRNGGERESSTRVCEKRDRLPGRERRETPGSDGGMGAANKPKMFPAQPPCQARHDDRKFETATVVILKSIWQPQRAKRDFPAPRTQMARPNLNLGHTRHRDRRTNTASGRYRQAGDGTLVAEWPSVVYRAGCRRR